MFIAERCIHIIDSIEYTFTWKQLSVVRVQEDHLLQRTESKMASRKRAMPFGHDGFSLWRFD